MQVLGILASLIGMCVSAGYIAARVQDFVKTSVKDVAKLRYIAKTVAGSAVVLVASLKLYLTLFNTL